MRKTIAVVLCVISACSSAGGPKSNLTNLAGTPYNPAAFRTRLSAMSAADRVIYEVDPEEMNWAEQNLNAVLDREVKLAVEDIGVIRIAEVVPGSIAEIRGLRAGDLVRGINGVAVDLSNLHAFLAEELRTRERPLVLDVERDGGRMTIEFRRLR